MGQLITGVRCPKCGGNLYLDRDYNGWYEQCLQCSYMKDLAVVFQSKKKEEKEALESVPAKKKGDINRKNAARDK